MRDIPMEEWGKDHWSTFAYIEACVVDQKGVISNTKMRCNPRLHRNMVTIIGSNVLDGSKYPTRLKGDKKEEEHDDWSCVDDMVEEKLIRIVREKKVSDQIFGSLRITVTLTSKGRLVANALREYKSNGGQFFNFEYLE